MMFYIQYKHRDRAGGPPGDLNETPCVAVIDRYKWSGLMADI